MRNPERDGLQRGKLIVHGFLLSVRTEGRSPFRSGFCADVRFSHAECITTHPFVILIPTCGFGFKMSLSMQATRAALGLCKCSQPRTTRFVQPATNHPCCSIFSSSFFFTCNNMPLRLDMSSPQLPAFVPGIILDRLSCFFCPFSLGARPRITAWPRVDAGQDIGKYREAQPPDEAFLLLRGDDRFDVPGACGVKAGLSGRCRVFPGLLLGV